MPAITWAELRATVDELLESAPAGPDLSNADTALVQYAVHSSVATLDQAGAHHWAGRALDGGVSPDQLHETLVLMSGLGMHTLMEGSAQLDRLAQDRGLEREAPTVGVAGLREQRERPSGYWSAFEQHTPGFLEALARQSPTAYEGFMDYGALPARSGHLTPLQREVIAAAADATPFHRYLPGLRFHIANALRLGAGRTALTRAVDIAGAAPAPPGVS